MSDNQIIVVEHLVKKYRNLVAVDDISFSVPEGEIFGFLGPNGAGKTTTINVLCTLLKLTSGKVTLNGFDVVRQQNQVRQSIGLVFQDPSLDERLTALENLRFHALIYNMPSSVSNDRIEQMLKMVELWERRKDVVLTFSGGMKRRLELARGLLHYPKVLFLDEPTLGLDPQTRSRLWEFILDLRQNEGITVFLTTHYMDEAGYADHIAIIDNGKIIALDTPDGLKSMVSGDIITLKTADDDRAAEEIRLRYQTVVKRERDALTFEVVNGGEFIPSFVKDFDTTILSISVHRATLDDVFLKLTGRGLRDQEAGAKETFRKQMQQMSESRRR